MSDMSERFRRAKKLSDGKGDDAPEKIEGKCVGCSVLVDLARTYAEEGSEAWAYDADRSPYGRDTNKCNLFVYEMANAAKMPVPMVKRYRKVNGVTIPFLPEVHPPLAGQWADPDFVIPGWEIVTDPKPGDIAAEYNGNYTDATGHVAIVSGDKLTISAGGEKILENDWGYRDSNKNVVYRRYVGTGN